MISLVWKKKIKKKQVTWNVSFWRMKVKALAFLLSLWQTLVAGKTDWKTVCQDLSGNTLKWEGDWWRKSRLSPYSCLFIRKCHRHYIFKLYFVNYVILQLCIINIVYKESLFNNLYWNYEWRFITAGKNNYAHVILCIFHLHRFFFSKQLSNSLILSLD